MATDDWSVGVDDGDVIPVIVTVVDVEKLPVIVTIYPLFVQDGEQDIVPSVKLEANVTTALVAVVDGVNVKVSVVDVDNVAGLNVPFNELIFEGKVLVTVLTKLLE